MKKVLKCVDLSAAQGTLESSSALQFKSINFSALAFFMVQLSHLYMITEKTVALTIQAFVGKLMSLLFNMLSRFVIVFLPRSKCLLISWLQPPSIVILEPEKIKSVTVSTFPPSVCHGVMGPDPMIFVFWMFPSCRNWLYTLNLMLGLMSAGLVIGNGTQTWSDGE